MLRAVRRAVLNRVDCRKSFLLEGSACQMDEAVKRDRRHDVYEETTMKKSVADTLCKHEALTLLLCLTSGRPSSSATWQ